jgi:prevent-host-death family protein
VTITVGVQEAKTNLSRLLDQVSGGAEVVIQRRGRPVAVLTAVSAPAVRLGFMPGAVDEAASMAPLDAAELALWEGGR